MTVDRGDLVWLNFSPQRGHEQSGRRPALVISPAAYNAVSNCVIVCPITSNTDPWPWKAPLPDTGYISGAVLVDQVKSVDATARKLEPANASVDDTLMDDILSRLATLT